jgi:hypothetical protein
MRKTYKDAVLVLPRNSRYHTSVYCTQIYDTKRNLDRVSEVTVQTRLMARSSGHNECTTDECQYLHCYLLENGWALANERD